MAFDQAPAFIINCLLTIALFCEGNEFKSFRPKTVMGNALENLYIDYKNFTDFYRGPPKVFSNRN
jgi:hypothetical protein